MATRFDQKDLVSRMKAEAPGLPTALVALAGNEAIIRGAIQARGWILDTWARGIRETQRNVKPMRKTTRRELRKGRKLAEMVPFFPAIPLVPVAVVTGLAVTATVMGVRASRRDRAIMDRLDAIEADLARFRQQREHAMEGQEQEMQMLGAQPAQLPWT